MRKSAKFLGVAILCGSMSACVGLNPNPSDDLDLYFVDVDAARSMAPEGTPFAQGLRTGYFSLTDYEKSTADLSDASHFARKAVSSAKGLNVQPDAVAFLIKSFKGCFLLVSNPGRHHITIVGGTGLAHDYNVAIVDQGIDHGVSLDLQGVNALFIRDKIAGYINHIHVLVKSAFGHLDRLACGDTPQQRHFH